MILDFDGVLIDSEQIAILEWHALLRTAELDQAIPVPVLPDGVLDRLELARRLRTTVGSGRAQELSQEFERRNQIRVDTAELLPGVAEFLADCRAAGRMLAIASGNSPRWVLGHLDRLRIRPAFSLVTCSSAGMASKPAPDTYLATLRQCGVPAQVTLAIEDSYAGLAAAAAAGIPVIWAAIRATADDPPTPVVQRVRRLSEVTFPPRAASSPRTALAGPLG